MTPLLYPLLVALAVVRPAVAASDPPAGWVGVIADPGAVTLRAASGGRLAEILVAVGDRVRAGQRLARIEPGQIAAQLAFAEAQMDAALAEAEARTAAARLLEERLARLESHPEAVAAATVEELRTELERARAEARAAAARLRQQRSEHDLVRSRVGRSELLAPIDGVVVERLANPGTDLAPEAPVLRLGSQQPPILRFAFEPETQLERGAAVWFVTESPSIVSGPARALVHRIAPTIDDASGLRTAEAVVELSIPGAVGSSAVGLPVRVYRNRPAEKPASRANQ